MLVFGLLDFNSIKKLCGSSRTTNWKYLLYAILGFFLVGVYGGFINAGIGIVIMLVLNRMNRLSLVKTNATKVWVVFIYSSVALVLFAYNGAVDWKMGSLMAFGTLLEHGGQAVGL